MKKILSILVCVCVLLSAMVFTASAADGVSISFADKSARTSYSTSQQVWEQNGIKVTNDKGASTTNVGDYSNPGRFYKNSTVTIEYTGMTGMFIDSVTYTTDDYAGAWVDSFDTSLGTATVADGDVTIVFNSAVDSVTFAKMAAQARAYSITVYTGVVTPPAGDEDDKPVELPAPDATNTLTIEEAIELGAAQDTSAYTADKYYVTGKITAVSNTQYGNMYIADEDGNEILIYGTYGADGKDRYDALASKPDEGDTVTVYGVVGNFNGTPQLKNAWIIEFTAGELDIEAPTEPEADSVLTIAEAIELGLTKRSNEFTTNKYYVTGVITEIYNEEYGNMRITDDAGNILTLYGTWEVLDEIRFDAMENKPAVGDTITVYGIIGQYNGTPQMKNGVFTTAPDTDDDTTNDNDNATGGTTGGADTSTDNTDNSTTSPSTGDNVGAIVAMAVAAAAVLVASKKR